jgi:hypothetical protein
MKEKDVYCISNNKVDLIIGNSLLEKLKGLNITLLENILPEIFVALPLFIANLIFVLTN